MDLNLALLTLQAVLTLPDLAAQPILLENRSKLEGTCNKLQTGSSPNLMSERICKFYASNQTCRFGKHCRFSHPQRPPFSNPVPESEEQYEASGVTSFTQSQLAPSELIDQGDLKLKSQNEVDLNRSSTEDTHRQSVCPYFAKGWCRYGKSCRLSHALPQRAFQSNRTVGSKGHTGNFTPPRFCQIKKDAAHRNSEDKTKADAASQGKTFEASATSTILQNQVEKQQRQFRQICVYFKSGQCKKGTNCKFLHENQPVSIKFADAAQEERSSVAASLIEENKNASEKDAKPPKPQGLNRMNGRQYGSQSRLMFTHAELDEVGREKVRSNEIEAIKKRFPRDKIMHNNDEENFVARIKFTPSDPDWVRHNF